MNNLTCHGSFGFLAPELPKTYPPNCHLAWITDRFYLAGNNYFVYTCSNCREKQIKQGQKPNIWGGQNV